MQTGQGIFSPVGESVLHTYTDLCDSRVHLGVFLALLSVQLQLSSLQRENLYVHDTDDSCEPLLAWFFPECDFTKRPWSSLRGHGVQVSENNVNTDFSFLVTVHEMRPLS